MKSLPLQFLRENGLLFEINRVVLHPLGLSLSLHEDGRMELFQTSDPAGMVFTADTFDEGERKLREFMELEGESRHAARRAFLRYVEQTDPDQGDSVPPAPGSVG